MPVRKNATFKAAIADHQNQDYKNAIAKLNELEKHFPDNWLIKYNKGHSKFQEGLRIKDKKLIKSAIQDYNEAIVLSRSESNESVQHIEQYIASAEAYLK